MKNVIIALFLTLTLAACGCPKNGKDGAPGRDGVDGASGAPGSNGSDGSNGHNSLVAIVQTAPGCSNGGVTLLTGVDLDDSSALEASEITASAEVCNGLNGSNGQDGQDGQNGSDGADAPPTPFTPVGIVDPCGDAPGVYDEVFVKLQNGTLLASFSENANGKNTRFSVLTPGTYVTTDGDNCVFTVTAGGSITGENHHY